jgi:hypothetical protein
MIIESKQLLETPDNKLSFGDRIRRQQILAPFVILFYCLILNKGILDGWAGWYYAFQRVLAELLLSIRLIETEKLQKCTNQDNTYAKNAPTPILTTATSPAYGTSQK